MTGWLATSDGLRLAAHRWDRSAPGSAAVVLVHGFTGSRLDPRVAAVAETLCHDGFEVLTYDARGHGESDGHCTLGALEHLDVAAAVCTARTGAERVVLVGASMGAIAVLRHAAGSSPDVDGVVAVSAPAGWRVPPTPRGALATLITRTRAGRFLAARRLGVRVVENWQWSEPPVSLVGRIHVPLAIVHGLRDRFIPVDDAQELYARATSPRLLDLVEGMSHAYDSAAIPAIRRAVSWVLAASPEGAGPG